MAGAELLRFPEALAPIGNPGVMYGPCSAAEADQCQQYASIGAKAPLIIRSHNGTAYYRVGDNYLEAVEWNMIFNSTSAATASNGWYVTDNSTCGMTATVSAKIKVRTSYGEATGMFAKCYDYGTGDSSWIKLENGWDHFAEPCGTAVSEWAWANDGEHECTVSYRQGIINNGFIYAKPMTPEELKIHTEKMLKRRIHEVIQSRCSPNIIVRNNTKRQPLAMPTDIREQRARETLRRVIGDAKFTNFVRHGFISVKARSGLVYQIFTGHGITHVFNQGNLVERLCVVLQGNFPPTDSLIMRYLLILNNEQQFRSFAVKHSVEGYQTGRSHQQNGQADIRPLAEIFKELKRVA